MPRTPLPLLALALGAVAALGLVACGGEDAKLLPGETAREITANLDTVKQLAGEGDCVGAESAVQQVGEQIETLEGVDPKLKRALEEGAGRLEEVIAGCEESSSEAIAPAEIPSEFEEEEEEEKPTRRKEPRAKEKEAKPGDEEEAPEAQSPPPEAKGEGKGKGLENGNGPPPPEEPTEETPGGSPSGGVGPGAAVEGGE